MLTHMHNHNGGCYAAAASHRAPRRVRGPHLQPQGSLTRSLHLEWSNPSRHVDLADRHQRARFYEVVLREGGPTDILTYIDGALLVDLWPELVLPRHIRAAWTPVVENRA